MQTLTDHPITERWPPQRPDAIQLYSFPTPNGQKAGIALEELGLPYEAHRVSLADGDQRSEAFLSLNPNNKIPAMIDPWGAQGRAVPLWESGVILTYLAEKTGQLGGTGEGRLEVQRWLHFQIGGLGPMFGQLGHFVKMAGAKVEDPYPRERYVGETKHYLDVLERQLSERDWVAGTYSIADIAIGPWLRTLVYFYEAKDLVGWETYRHVPVYLERFLDRPAVQAGLNVPPREG